MRLAVFIAALALAPSLAFADPGAPAINEPLPLPDGYQLVWSDEFESESGLPDATKWSYDTHANRTGWYNEERQYYSGERAKNARLENGLLIIEAHRERVPEFADYGGQDYTSTRLVTQGRAAWTYGYFEIRAKLPCGRGAWPAIWTLAAENRDGWPRDGEIDIMEHVGHDPGVVHGTVHTGAYNHTRNTHRSAQNRVADVCTALHTYQLHWTPDRIVIGMDGRGYYQFSRDAEGGRDAWPFDSPHYLILNIAVGGTWGGAQGIDDSAFPVRMAVDYVRVYQRQPR